MKIITKGKIPPPKEYQATCKHCGTVFVFEELEAKLNRVPYSNDSREHDYYTVNCPLCHTELVVSLLEGLF